MSEGDSSARDRDTQQQEEHDQEKQQAEEHDKKKRQRKRKKTEFGGLGPQRSFLLVVVLGISLLFLVMVRDFAVTVLLAGVFAGMGRPIYLWLEGKLRGRSKLSSMLTVLALLLLIVVPLGAFLALVVSQAVDIGQQAGPWIREQSGRWPEIAAWLRDLPGVGGLVPDEGVLISRASDLVSRLGTILVNNVGAATSGTVEVVLQTFVLLYAMYFFLLDGPSILGRILHYSPLEESDERQLVEQFVSVTRATIKGSLLIGLLQGALAGGALFALRLPGAAFWTTVMAVLSIIPPPAPTRSPIRRPG